MGSSKPTAGSVPTLTPQQQSLQNQVIERAQGQFANLPSESLNLHENPLYQGNRDVILQALRPKSDDDLESQFEALIGAPALRQFTRQILPNLQGQFAQLGAGRSSALNQAMAAAGQDLATDLASQRQQYLQNQRQFQLQAGQAGLSAATLPLSQQLQLFGPAMASATSPYVQGPQPGALSQALGFAGPIAANYAYGRGLGSNAQGGQTGMGSTLGGAGGTAVGALLGGPIGGMLGGALGGALFS